MAVRSEKNFQRFSSHIRGVLPAIAARAMEIVNTRAKDILTENGHVITGHLRRSGFVAVEETRRGVEAIVSFPPDYAERVENLDDGGYLFPALEQKTMAVKDYLVGELRREVSQFR